LKCLERFWEYVDALEEDFNNSPLRCSTCLCLPVLLAQLAEPPLMRYGILAQNIAIAWRRLRGRILATTNLTNRFNKSRGAIFKRGFPPIWPRATRAARGNAAR